MQYQLKNFNKLYHLIIQSFLAPIKYNDFPEGEKIKTNITSKLQKHNYIDKIFLTGHCAKSEKSPTEIHGINYLNIQKQKFYHLVDEVINELLKQYDINFLKQKEHRFQILITIKSLKETFLLAFDTFENEYIRSFNIDLISIYKQTELSNHYVYTKHGLIKPMSLKNVFIQSVNNVIWLNDISI